MACARLRWSLPGLSKHGVLQATAYDQRQADLGRVCLSCFQCLPLDELVCECSRSEAVGMCHLVSILFRGDHSQSRIVRVGA